ncbi:MAG TPA: YndJ family transporter [Anaeromyxobacteraceae bacterium]|nr:YndJ family transporter [Anaeromyxobacteraceae bacterium]
MSSTRRRWSLVSPTLGAAAWLAVPGLPVGRPPAFASIEHVFLLAPLVAAPLALDLLAVLLGGGGPAPRLQQAARLGQPAAAAMVLASFLLPRGPAAGGLAAGWLLLAGLVAAGGGRIARLGAGVNLSNASLLVAHLFLPVGAAWLLLSRLGVGPSSLAPATVFYAALHFHFSGFTLQILVGATGRLLPASCPRLGALHRLLAVGAVAGIPLIAAGNIAPSSVLKAVGVGCMVLSAMALAVTSTAVALQSRSRAARGLLLASAASISAGMAVAGIYGLGELTGSVWIGISRMVQIHGLVNALGFTLCGLTAHLRLGRDPRGPGEARRAQGAWTPA